MYNLALPYFLTISLTIYQIKSFSLRSFLFQQVPLLSFTKQMATMALLAKATKPPFFKVIQYGYETFIVPILQSIAGPEINTASITHKTLL